MLFPDSVIVYMARIQYFQSFFMCVILAFVDLSGPLLQYVCPDDRPAITHLCHRGSQLEEMNRNGPRKLASSTHTKDSEIYRIFEIY